MHNTTDPFKLEKHKLYWKRSIPKFQVPYCFQKYKGFRNKVVNTLALPHFQPSEV